MARINYEKTNRITSTLDKITESNYTTTTNGFKLVTMKFRNRCGVCGKYIKQGQTAMWHRQSGFVIHDPEYKGCNI